MIAALRNDLGPDLFIRTLEAGKHLMAEKPIGRTAADTERVIAVAERTGVRLGVCYQNRTLPAVQLMRSLVGDGLIGPLISVEMRMITTRVAARNPRNWLFHNAHAGGGILSWLGCHYIDMIRYVTGDEIVAVIGVLEHDLAVEAGRHAVKGAGDALDDAALPAFAGDEGVAEACDHRCRIDPSRPRGKAAPDIRLDGVADDMIDAVRLDDGVDGAGVGDVAANAGLRAGEGDVVRGGAKCADLVCPVAGQARRRGVDTVAARDERGDQRAAKGDDRGGERAVEQDIAGHAVFPSR